MSESEKKEKKKLSNELQKTFKHISVMNSEMGNVDARLGRIEGQLIEALPEIKKDIGAIFNKFNKLKCIENSNALVELKTNMKTIMKSRAVIGAALVTAFITYALSVIF